MTRNNMPGHLDVVRLLIKHGADLELKDHSGDGALAMAALNDHSNVMELLLLSGAKVDNCQHARSKEKSSNLLAKLLADPKNIKPYVFGVVTSGNLDAIKEIVANKRKAPDRFKILTSGRNIDDESALMLAVKKGFDEIVTLLVAEGANVNVTSKGGKSALTIAFESDSQHIVTELINDGADVNTALRWASSEGRIDIVERLLKERSAVNSEIDIDALDHSGSTALIRAIENGRAEVITSLVNHGADVNKANANGRTAIDIALSDKMWDLGNTLFSAPQSKVLPSDQSLLFEMVRECYPPGKSVSTIANSIYRALLSKDSATNSKLTDVERPGETYISAIWSKVAQSRSGDQLWQVCQEASDRYIQHDIAETHKHVDDLAALCKKHVGDSGARYRSTHNTIKKEGSYSEYVETLQNVVEILQNGQHGKMQMPTQTTESLKELYDNCLSLKPRFDAFIKKICEKAQNEAQLCDELKGPYRSLQKAAKKKGSSGAKACKDVLRAIAGMSTIGKGKILLELFLGCDVDKAKHTVTGDSSSSGVDEKIVIVWLKDRWTEPTNGGWADTLVNFYFADDETKTICEVQLPHLDMMSIRERQNGHNGYDELRKAVELLTIVGKTEVVAEIEAEAKKSMMRRTVSASNRIAPPSSADESADSLTRGVQQCFELIQGLQREQAKLKKTVSRLESENASLTAKVQTFEGAQSNSEFDDFGGFDDSADGTGGADGADYDTNPFGGFDEHEESLEASSLSSDAMAKLAALSSRIDDLDFKISELPNKQTNSTHPTTSGPLNGSDLEIEVQGIADRLNKVQRHLFVNHKGSAGSGGR